MSVFYVTFSGIYVPGYAIVIADDKNEAIELVMEQWQEEVCNKELLAIDIEDVIKIPIRTHGVFTFDSGDY